MAGPVARPEGLPEPVRAADFPEISFEAARLGQSLFFDPILSGNDNIACATCHHPTLGSSDGVALSIGEGGFGLGPARHLPAGGKVDARIPRNAPALWNKGANSFEVLFHDGRVSRDGSAKHGIKTPQGALNAPVINLLAAQALFPMTSADEMAGQAGENPIADVVAAGEIKGEGGAWDLIAAKVAAVPEYRVAFDWVIGADQPIHITDIANALASFMTVEFRSTDSPFDRYLRGDEAAMSETQKLGMALFYGEAGCSGCHAGVFQTDQQFHAIAMPQIGPGKSHADAAYADIGRAAISGDAADAYKFLTPSLRNVTLTAPYGHAGGYGTLEQVIRHHMEPAEALARYDGARAILAPLAAEALGAGDFAALLDPEEVARIAAARELDGVALHEGDIATIIAFLTALEDPRAKAGRLGVPKRVLSGLPMDVPAEPVALAAAPSRSPRPDVSHFAQVPEDKAVALTEDMPGYENFDTSDAELIAVDAAGQ